MRLSSHSTCVTFAVISGSSPTIKAQLLTEAWAGNTARGQSYTLFPLFGYGEVLLKTTHSGVCFYSSESARVDFKSLQTWRRDEECKGRLAVISRAKVMKGTNTQSEKYTHVSYLHSDNNNQEVINRETSRYMSHHYRDFLCHLTVS